MVILFDDEQDINKQQIIIAAIIFAGRAFIIFVQCLIECQTAIDFVLMSKCIVGKKCRYNCLTKAAGVYCTNVDKKNYRDKINGKIWILLNRNGF